MLLNYHIGRFVLVSLCVGDLVLMGLSSIRVAGCSQIGNCPDLATLEGSSCTDIMTCTGGCGYSF